MELLHLPYFSVSENARSVEGSQSAKRSLVLPFFSVSENARNIVGSQSAKRSLVLHFFMEKKCG